MNVDNIVNRIVEEVLIRLKERLKCAAVLFTGGAYGFQEAIQQVRLLIEGGWDLKILLSESASYVLTPEIIKEELGVQTVYVESEIKGLSSFYEGISMLIIPTLTLNTAVKISVGIADSLATNLVSHSIMTGIPIVAAKDGCQLDHPIREQFGLNKAPESYLENMEKHLITLESYGMNLVNANQLFQEAEKIVASFFKTECSSHRSEKMEIYKKRVLARTDIIEARLRNKVLKIPAATIVSPLAIETAREVGLELIRE